MNIFKEMSQTFWGGFSEGIVEYGKLFKNTIVLIFSLFVMCLFGVLLLILLMIIYLVETISRRQLISDGDNKWKWIKNKNI